MGNTSLTNKKVVYQIEPAMVLCCVAVGRIVPV